MILWLQKNKYMKIQSKNIVIKYIKYNLNFRLF